MTNFYQVQPQPPQPEGELTTNVPPDAEPLWLDMAPRNSDGNIRFEDWHREQMKDPWFRFWCYVYEPQFQLSRLYYWLKPRVWRVRYAVARIIINFGARVAAWDFSFIWRLMEPLPPEHYEALKSMDAEPPCCDRDSCSLWSFWDNEADAAYDDL